MRKKIPPYSKKLGALQKQGLCPFNSVYLWIGRDAWTKASKLYKQMPERTMVLPPWESADIYEWPVEGCDILIFDTSGAPQDYVEELVCCLYEHNAKIVRYLPRDKSLIVYHKE